MTVNNEFYIIGGGGIILRPSSLRFLNEFVEIKNLRCKLCNSPVIINHQSTVLCTEDLNHNPGYYVNIDPAHKHPPFIMELPKHEI